MIDGKRRITLYLKAQNMTPNSLAFHAGLSHAWLSMYLSGKRRMSEGAARKLAATMNVSWKTLMED